MAFLHAAHSTDGLVARDQDIDVACHVLERRSASRSHWTRSEAAAVGDRVEVYVDGGILSGADIVAAVGFGARAALGGRAYLYGLMAGGERGVARAGELLRKELVRTMQLMGVSNFGGLSPSRVRLRDR